MWLDIEFVLGWVGWLRGYSGWCEDDKCRKGRWGYMMESLNVLYFFLLIIGRYLGNGGWN